MSLGLGELPPELLGITPVAEARGARAAAPSQPEPRVFDLDAESLVVETPLSADGGPLADEAMDLNSLLESLDRENDDAVSTQAPASLDQFVSVEPTDSDADLPREGAQSELPGGAISTELYTEEMSLEAIGLSGGMTDELSALTGADRPLRPVVNVAGIPERPLGALKRDQNVDKDTVLRIIEGIKSL